MTSALSTLIALALLSAPATAVRDQPGKQVVSGQTTITLPDTSSYSAAAKKILDLEVERSGAIARHDTRWLATLYAEDFQGVPANGQRVDRAALFRVFSADAPASKFLIDGLAVRDFGSSATVMGRLRTTNLTGEVQAESRYLHVYVQRNGQWWIVAAIGSPVQKTGRGPD